MSDLKDRATHALLFAITALIFVPVCLAIFSVLILFFCIFCLVGPLLILTGHFELTREGQTVRLKPKRRSTS